MKMTKKVYIVIDTDKNKRGHRDKKDIDNMIHFYIHIWNPKQLHGMWNYTSSDQSNIFWPVFRELDDAKEYSEFMKSNIGMISEIKEMEVTIK